MPLPLRPFEVFEIRNDRWSNYRIAAYLGAAAALLVCMIEGWVF